MVILGGEVVCGILGNTALLLRRPSHVETPEQAPVVGAERWFATLSGTAEAASRYLF